MPKRPKRTNPEHTIPGPVTDSTLAKVVLKQPEHEERSIREYVESQAEKEKVTHVEKITTEQVFGRKFDAWDVRTDKERYWVITNPSNLYSHSNFPSLDYTLSFHIGVTERVMARQSLKAPGDRLDVLETTWRKWEQAAEQLDTAEEAEEFQAIGLTCRECLIDFVKVLSSHDVVPEGQIAPKAADFIQWSDLIANAIVPGESGDRIRGYLKASSKSTWQLVSWLTHASNAVRFDGILAVETVRHLLETFAVALIRGQKGIPERCPRCSSYRLIRDYRAEMVRYILLCEACGWNELQSTSRGARRLHQLFPLTPLHASA